MAKTLHLAMKIAEKISRRAERMKWMGGGGGGGVGELNERISD